MQQVMKMDSNSGKARYREKVMAVAKHGAAEVTS